MIVHQSPELIDSSNVSFSQRHDFSLPEQDAPSVREEHGVFNRSRRHLWQHYLKGKPPSEQLKVLHKIGTLIRQIIQQRIDNEKLWYLSPQQINKDLIERMDLVLKS